MHAEQAYLFRHALLRDAAYSLQMPSARAKLHLLALRLLEELLGGVAPQPPPLDAYTPRTLVPFSSDSAAMEMAYHAGKAKERVSERLYLRRAAHFGEKSYQHMAAAEAWSKFAALVEGEERVLAYCHAGGCCSDAGNMKLAEQSYAMAKSVAGEWHAAEARADSGLAAIRWVTGRVDEAAAGFRQAAEKHRQYANHRELAHTLCNHSLLLQEQGDLDAAVALAREAMALFERLNAKGGVAHALLNVGVVSWAKEDLTSAEAAYKECLRLSRETGDRRTEGTALSNLAVLMQERRDFAQAEELYQQSIQVHLEVGNRRFLGIAAHNLAALHFNTGQVETAEKELLAALALHREVQNQRWEALALHALGAIASDSGRQSVAKELMEAARRTAIECGARDIQLLIHQEQKAHRSRDGVSH
ncbi:MAG: tetratricopeptide repeat protein [Planctomycetes bacterium]|nr:tetratricopeptide repeat protein [Planctomycetota bacterium]